MENFRIEIGSILVPRQSAHDAKEIADLEVQAMAGRVTFELVKQFGAGHNRNAEIAGGKCRLTGSEGLESVTFYPSYFLDSGVWRMLSTGHLAFAMMLYTVSSPWMGQKEKSALTPRTIRSASLSAATLRTCSTTSPIST